ncbi:MAG: PilW family protein [Verrucomicrobiales bacterium]
MDCKITFTKARREAGASLVELLVSLAVGSVVLAAIGSLMFYTGRSFSSLANYVDLDNYSRTALDTMSREIRQTRRLVSGSETALEFEDFDGKKLAYIYDATARTLVREHNGVRDPNALLKECNYLKFTLYQRNPVAGSYDQYPTADAATCKLVQLRWVCSRDLVHARWNTESVQSAKIVIRNQ